MSDLALLGGPKTIKEPFARYNSIGKEEVQAAKAVVESGILSKFLGCWDPDFYGGEKIQTLERNWAEYFRVKHAITVNSNTSGLIAAIGAVGVEPGDEVIVSPWTMCASATAILVWNAIPVFADIEDQTFNLDPASIERNITPYTKAIMVTDIFGHPADLDAIMAIAKKKGLKVIEDCAQAPGAFYQDKYAGTIADIGVYSLNCHKHFHTGEGGVCVTNDDNLCERLQLIRNHGEAVVEDKGVENLANLIGFNFRMTEVEAAIGIEQLKKINTLVNGRVKVASKLLEGLKGLEGLRVPVIKPDCSHVFYVFPLIYDSNLTGLSRAVVLKALQAEGLSISGSYTNLHLLPIYQKKIAYGSHGFPWRSEIYKGSVSYRKGICPTAESLHDEKYLGIEMCAYVYTEREIELIIQTFHKVWNNFPDLKKYAANN